LTIELPTASASLDTDRIALTRGRTRFDYYASSVWMDRLPVLVQTLMVDAFQADGHIAEVGRDDNGLTRGYLLRTEIRGFEAHYDGLTAGPPEIAIVLELQLSTGPEGRLLGTRLITARAHASENKLDSVIMAFDSAIGGALTDSVVWTTRAISADRMHRVHR
jgi:cholesterol transport system auxiliary component